MLDKKTCSVLILLTSLITPALTAAQITQPSFNFFTNPWSSCTTGTDCLVSGYGAQQYSIFLTPPYDQAQLMAGGAALPFLLKTPRDLAAPLILKDILTSLTTTSTTLTTILNNTVTTNEALLPIPKPSTKSKIFGFLATTTGQAKDNPRLDLTSLLGPLHYDDKGAAAQNFINVVSGQNAPLPIIDFSSVSQIPGYNSTLYNTIITDPAIAPYLATILTYTAQVAVGTSALYRYMGERMPVPNTSANTANSALTAAIAPPSPTMLTNLPKDPSVLQVREYLATRRLKDPAWFTQLQNESSLQLERQMVILLAEMRAEQFYTEMDLERINAAQSVQILQSAMTQRALLSGSPLQQNAQSALTGYTTPPTTNTPASSGGPATTTTPQVSTPTPLPLGNTPPAGTTPAAGTSTNPSSIAPAPQ